MLHAPQRPSSPLPLSPLGYEAIREIAAQVWTSTGRSSWIDATDLANECYLRLARREPGQGLGADACRAQRVSYCATIIRRLLVDEARRRQQHPFVSRPTMILSSAEAREAGPTVVSIVALDEALQILAEVDERQARIVELRFFGGLDRTETAEILGISVRTLAREWGLARSWLLQHLSAAA